MSQIKDVVGNADKKTKEKMLDALGQVLAELRDPMDVLYSTYGAVRLQSTSYGCNSQRLMQHPNVVIGNANVHGQSWCRYWLV